MAKQKEKQTTISNDELNPIFVKTLDDKKLYHMIVEILSIAIAAAAIAVALYSLIYTVNTEEKKINTQSYFEPLNYEIEFDENYLTEIIDQTENTVSIKSPIFSIVPETGGINQVDVIYYYDDICFAVLQLDLVKEVQHEKYKASNLATKITDFSDRVRISCNQ